MAAGFSFIILSFSFIASASTSTYTCDPTISCGCSTSSTAVTSRIIGGEVTSNYSWGWMVSLRLSGKHRCGASLLSSEYAVTAAHCVVDFCIDLSALSIVVGTNYLDDQSSATIQRRTITRITSHSGYYSGSLKNDIAILRFSPLTVSSSSKLAFICLPNANEDPFTINMTVQVLSSTSRVCERSRIEDSSLQLCAGLSTGGKDSCRGDSGSSLMAFVNNRWVLAGITSGGVRCGMPGYVGIYTRVSAFISFINSSTNSLTLRTTTVAATNFTSRPNNNNQSSGRGHEGTIISNSIVIVISILSLLLLCSE